MTRRQGIVAFVAAFAASFFWLRSTSTFARVEARLADAEAIATSSGLDVVEVMALLDLGEGRTPTDELSLQAERVARARREHGELGLAVAVAFGHGALVRRLLAEDGAGSALARLRARREGILVTRYLTMVERYAGARDRR